jgi:hypothetical protein
MKIDVALKCFLLNHFFSLLHISWRNVKWNSEVLYVISYQRASEEEMVVRHLLLSCDLKAYISCDFRASKQKGSSQCVHINRWPIRTQYDISNSINHNEIPPYELMAPLKSRHISHKTCNNIFHIVLKQCKKGSEGKQKTTTHNS